jgi:hypothetical protein
MGSQLVAQELAAAHEPRPVRFLRHERAGAWRLKLYGIALPGEEVRGELGEAAMELAPGVFPSPARDEGRYGIGYITVHDAATFCLALLLLVAVGQRVPLPRWPRSRTPASAASGSWRWSTSSRARG